MSASDYVEFSRSINGRTIATFDVPVICGRVQLFRVGATWHPSGLDLPGCGTQPLNPVGALAADVTTGLSALADAWEAEHPEVPHEH